jgi:hypothetical protein
MTESNAIRHSRARLENACEALQRLDEAQTLDAAERAWSALLLAGNAIYSKLEQGSKVNGQATAWFGRAKHKRKYDPLLCYMHHARNAEEHTIEDVTNRRKAGEASFTFREPFDPKKLEGLQLRVDLDKRGQVLVSSSDEDVVSTEMYDKPSLVLVRVKDSGVYFDPPYEHLGIGLPSRSPSTIGSLFVVFLTTLIDEAKTLGI